MKPTVKLIHIKYMQIRVKDFMSISLVKSVLVLCIGHGSLVNQSCMENLFRSQTALLGSLGLYKLGYLPAGK